jgi:dihydrodiol dehydrogenase / D-xylose 1-dehydrogenase (NADP)
MSTTQQKQQHEFVANWGIVSTGLISEDFAKAIKSWSEKKHQHQVVGVSARDLDSAKEFAEKFQIPTYYDSYEKLFADKNVNVVYIGSVNQTHRELCLKAIEAGKHVLCEKPMTINRAEQEDVLKAAEKKNVFFMEVQTNK